MTKPTKWHVRPVWSESSLCTKWVAEDPMIHHADSEDSDKTGWMPRLIRVFAGNTLILLVLTCRGSFTIKLSLGKLNFWARAGQYQQNDLCIQGRLRSAWTSAQSIHWVVSPVWSWSLLSFGSKTDQTCWIPGLIWVLWAQLGNAPAPLFEPKILPVPFIVLSDEGLWTDFQLGDILVLV